MAPFPSSHPSFPVSTGLRWGDRQGPSLEAGFPEQPPAPSPAIVQPSRPPCKGCGQKPSQVGAAWGAAELGKQLCTGTKARESPVSSLLRTTPGSTRSSLTHPGYGRTMARRWPLARPVCLWRWDGAARSDRRQAGPILHLRAISEPNSALMQAGSQVNCTNLGLFWALHIYL